MKKVCENTILHWQRLQKEKKANVRKKIQYNVCGIILRRQKEQEGWRTVITFRTEKSFESTGFDKYFSGYISKTTSCFYAADLLMKSHQLLVREIFSVTKSISKSHSSCVCNWFFWVFLCFSRDTPDLETWQKAKPLIWTSNLIKWRKSWPARKTVIKIPSDTQKSQSEVASRRHSNKIPLWWPDELFCLFRTIQKKFKLTNSQFETTHKIAGQITHIHVEHTD